MERNFGKCRQNDGTNSYFAWVSIPKNPCVYYCFFKIWWTSKSFLCNWKTDFHLLLSIGIFNNSSLSKSKSKIADECCTNFTLFQNFFCLFLFFSLFLFSFFFFFTSTLVKSRSWCDTIVRHFKEYYKNKRAALKIFWKAKICLKQFKFAKIVILTFVLFIFWLT